MPKLNLNNPGFQADLFGLEKTDLTKVISTLRKLKQMSWDQVYSDRGLKWEYIASRDIYTLRASRKIRISASREGEVMHLLSIHPDHDSAYSR